MNKKQLVSSGVIATLLASNVTLGYQYYTDTKELNQEVDQQKVRYIAVNQQFTDMSNYLEKQQGELEGVRVLYNEVNRQLKHYKIKNKAIHKRNEKLSKELKQYISNKNEFTGVVATNMGNKSKTLTFTVTAFTAGYESTQKRKGQKGYGVTASGTTVKEGRTIACPRSMKFGTKVHIEGVGTRVCEDRGSRITAGHIDLYVSNLSVARKFGRQKLKVKIIS